MEDQQTSTSTPRKTTITTTNQLQQQQQQQPSSQQVSSSPLRKVGSSVSATSSNYLSNLVNKSSILFDSLKQQFNNTNTNSSNNNNANQQAASSAASHQIIDTNNNNYNSHVQARQTARPPPPPPPPETTNHYDNYKSNDSNNNNNNNSRQVDRQMEMQWPGETATRKAADDGGSPHNPMERSITSPNRDIGAKFTPAGCGGGGDGGPQDKPGAAAQPEGAPQLQWSQTPAMESATTNNNNNNENKWPLEGDDDHHHQRRQAKERQRRPPPPPLPPPPPRELVLQVTSSSLTGAVASSSSPSGSRTQAGGGGPFSSSSAPPTPPKPPNTSGTHPQSPAGRRHALQEHSFERDAAISCSHGRPSANVILDNKCNDKEKESTCGSGGGGQPSKAHKRASSIRSALRHAHLGPLRPSASKRRANAEKLAAKEAALAAAAASASATSSGGAGATPGGGLFEPPITQRAYERQTRRRGAMQGDARRQMSVDTIGLRQLTDEYLQNAGVKPIPTSGQCSLVALGRERPKLSGAGPGLGVSGSATDSTETGAAAADASVVAAVAAATSSPGAGPASLASTQAQCALEAQLYQAARLAAAKLESSSSGGHDPPPHKSGSARSSARPSHAFQHQSSCGPTFCGGGGASGGAPYLSSCNSQSDADSLSHVTILPGSLPWQCDVSIQCELLQAPPMFEPYETTGDILNTIAGPFRAPGGNPAASFDSNHQHHHHYHLSATLKRGLSAISQSHHLSPSTGGGGGGSSGLPMTTLNVVGSLKKSLSNTLDISRSNNHLRADLHSQDSLPTYSSFTNEPDDYDDHDNHQADDHRRRRTHSEHEHEDEPSQQQPPAAANEGFINQLASKLGQQSSKKFSVSRKGLQRALSFDCRGYKRLDGQPGASSQKPTTSGQDSTTSSNSNGPMTGGGLFQSRARTTTNTSNSSNYNNNKSTLALNSPRPYLPQSASQVDFQVPLLPYERMQEAIVSQRLLGGPPSQPQVAASDQPQSTAAAAAAVEAASGGADEQLDADELICGRTCQTAGGRTRSESIESSRRQSGESNASYNYDKYRHCPSNRSSLGTKTGANDGQQQQQPPRLVLNIPTIATTDDEQDNNYSSSNGDATKSVLSSSPNQVATSDFSCQQQHLQQMPAAGMSQSPSFCIDTDGKSYLISHQPSVGGQSGGNQLTASDVFSRSKNFIKRPSTMVADNDAMSQVAQALESTTAAARRQEGGGSIRRTNRRQAIVPPKLATDANSGSDSEQYSGREPRVGQLIDVDDHVADDDHRDDDNDEDRHNQADTGRNLEDNNEDNDNDNEELNLLQTNRRKRSGGSNGAHHKEHPPTSTGQQQPRKSRSRALSGSQTNLAAAAYRDLSVGASTSAAMAARPDSQATCADSIVSSGSSATLSAYACGRLSATGGAGPNSGASSSLGVPFGGPTTRRRSSIAVIPQMQICPGDLLVYSKQLIDRMNQSDENEPPAQFLTIDDKKAKSNIWSSFKLCAQFDNRTMRARNQLLCSLEDVLASLQPSTFVDEQLSHYKGMLWNEFLYETESRRSASSEGAGNSSGDNDNNNKEEGEDKKTVAPASRSYKDDLVDVEVRISAPVEQQQPQPQPQRQSPNHRRSGSMKGNEPPMAAASSAEQQVASREPVKATMSGSATPVKQPVGGRLSSRFREKPKLKRGQTVDSVFRIPLIPSSPLKHAQQHQQTPTAHLEDHSSELITIEDDERSSLSGGATSTGSAGPADGDGDGSPRLDRHKRSSSTRSRGNSKQQNQLPVVANGTSPGANNNSNNQDEPSQPSSFEADDALDLINNNNGNGAKGLRQSKRTAGQSTTPNQIVRQSSLSTLSSTITRTEQKRQRALWDLFQSECAFFFDHLMTLKNVYMEPLKKIQVEGFAMFADPDVLFGNLDELCCGVYDFCKEFLHIIMRTLRTRPEELNATDVLIKLYKKNPKIDHLRAVYHRYTLNYINALTYLESLRRQVEFVEFEKWSSRDVRCKKLQLTDLLVAPVQHIMRVPIILKDIESHTEHKHDRDEIRAILSVEEASLRELDDKMRWLKNFERLLEIQKNISWPSVLDMEPKLYVPEALKEALGKQPCEKLIVSPRRQIVQEGTLANFDLGGKPSDLHVVLFDDMLLLMRKKKCLTKKASTVCKTNSGGPTAKDDGAFKYIVYKQPLSLDRFYVHDVQPVDAQGTGIKHLFVLIVLNRFQQVINVHSFSAPDDDTKQTWLFKLKKTAERWKRNNSGSSNDQQQQQQHQHQQQTIHHQQQQISSSKSMPVNTRPPTTRSVHHHQQQQQQPSIHLPSDQHHQHPQDEYATDQPRQLANATTPTRSPINSNTQHSQPGSNNHHHHHHQHQQRLPMNQPIELIVTSASESPNDQQTLSNASTVVTRCNQRATTTTGL